MRLILRYCRQMGIKLLYVDVVKYFIGHIALRAKPNVGLSANSVYLIESGIRGNCCNK